VRSVVPKIASCIKDFCPEIALKLIPQILNDHLLMKEGENYHLISVNKVILEFYIDILKVFLLADFKYALELET